MSWNGFGCQEQSNKWLSGCGVVEVGDSFKFDGKDSLGHSKDQWNVRQLAARLVKQISREQEPRC